jgi:hypothetical protein
MTAEQAHESEPTGADALDAALADLRSQLERDGFTAEWDVTDDEVGFRVVATDAACEECLVPKAVMEAMLHDAMDGTGFTLGAVRLPGDDPAA